MSSLTFKALIDAVYFNPKKGAVKINLIASSHVSMDRLTTLSPSDKPIKITLESEQTKIDVFPLTPGAQVSHPLDEDSLERLKDAEMELRKAQPFKSILPTSSRDNLDKKEGEDEEEDKIERDQED